MNFPIRWKDYSTWRKLVRIEYQQSLIWMCFRLIWLIDNQRDTYMCITKINTEYNRSMTYLQKYMNRLNDEMKWNQLNYLHMYGINLSKEMRWISNARYVWIELHRMFKWVWIERFEMQFGRFREIARIEKCHKANNINALSTINEIYID